MGLLLTPLALPFTVDHTDISLSFIADATVGCIMESATNLQTAFAIPTGGKAGVTLSHGQMVAVSYLDSNDFENISTPNATTQFAAYRHGLQTILEWNGLPTSNCDDNDTFWCRVVLEGNPEKSDEILVWGWCGRARGRSSTLLSMSPMWVSVQGYADTRAAETAKEAQARCRLFAPINTHFTVAGYPTQNSDFLHASNPGISSVQGHPAVGMFIPAVAVCNCNDEDVNYLETLMVYAKDPLSRRKQCTFRGAGDTDGLPTVQLAMSYLANAATDMGWKADRWGLQRETRLDNALSPRFPMAICRFVAKTDDWWFDICERYRESYETYNQPQRVPARFRPFRPSFNAKQSTLVVSIAQRLIDERFFFSDEEAPKLAEEINLAMGRAAVNVFHFQTWQDYPRGPIHNHDPQRSADPPELPSIVAKLKALGWRSSFYHVITHVLNLDYWHKHFPVYIFALERDGEQRKSFLPESLDDPALGLNYEVDGFSKVVDLIPASSLAEYQPGSIYLDIFCGHFEDTFNRSDKSPMLQPHPDDSSLRKNLVAVNLKKRGRRGGNDLEFCTISEVVEEGMFQIDYCLAGGAYMAGLTQLGDGTVGLTGFKDTTLPINDHAANTRGLTAPVWNAVFHEYQAAGFISCFWTNRYLATNPFDGYDNSAPDTAPDGAGAGGLTPASFIQFMCGGAAAQWISGSPTLTFIHGWTPEGDERMTEGGTAVLSVDPTAAADVVAAFYKLLKDFLKFEVAGAYLGWGRMERPPLVNYEQDVTTARNPASYNEYVEFGGYYFYGFSQTDESDWGSFNYPSPEVLCSAWSATTQFAYPHCLVLVNWSNNAAEWSGEIDLALWPRSVSPVDCWSIDVDGVQTKIATNLSGLFKVGTDPGDDVSLGNTIPALSVVVLVFAEAGLASPPEIEDPFPVPELTVGGASGPPNPNQGPDDPLHIPPWPGHHHHPHMHPHPSPGSGHHHPGSPTVHRHLPGPGGIHKHPHD